MNFASDNTGPAHPRVLTALARANEGHAKAYGEDALTAEVEARLADIFEAPGAAVALVGTGTAANALLVSTLAAPWQTVFCAEVSHLHEDECNAPEFYTGGAKLSLVASRDGKITPNALRARIAMEGTRGVHGPAPGPVSLTNVTERGAVYTGAEVEAVCAVAGENGLPVHLDGARFANALAATGSSPAEMSWKAGVDALSFGGTKNGLMAAEAAILFDAARAEELAYRRKRGAQLWSKHRFLAAQMSAFLEDGLWLDLAAAANARANELRAGLMAIDGVELLHEPIANVTFARWPRGLHRKALAQGVSYYLYEGPLESGAEDVRLTCRLVCHWATTAEDVGAFIDLLRRG